MESHAVDRMNVDIDAAAAASTLLLSPPLLSSDTDATDSATHAVTS